MGWISGWGQGKDLLMVPITATMMKMAKGEHEYIAAITALTAITAITTITITITAITAITATMMKMAKGEQEYIAWFIALRQALQASKGESTSCSQKITPVIFPKNNTS